MNRASAERAENIMAEIYGLADVREQLARIDEVIILEGTGCVVRSLESALGYPATLDEMRLRTSQVRELVKDAKSIRIDARSDFDRKILRQMDRKMVDRFIQEVSAHDTQLGRALNIHNFDRVSLTSDQVDKILEEGSILLLSFKLQGGQGHMAHLQNVDGNIVQKSDEGEIVNLDRNRTYEGILITPK